MQRIVPTSFRLSGDRILSIVSVLLVECPGLITDFPEKTSTSTFSPLKRASPTSILSSTGCPIKILLMSDFGTNRTNPNFSRSACHYLAMDDRPIYLLLKCCKAIMMEISLRVMQKLALASGSLVLVDRICEILKKQLDLFGGVY